MICLGDLAADQAGITQTLGPIVKAVFCDAQARAADRVCAAPFWCYRPVEKGQVRTRTARAIGEEQVIRRCIILVDGHLDAPQPEGFGVETVVARCVCGDGGQVVYACQVHGALL